MFKENSIESIEIQYPSNITWDEEVNLWLATYEKEGKVILCEHFKLINDAIAAVKEVSCESFKSF
jgi:hypothetical protein